MKKICMITACACLLFAGCKKNIGDQSETSPALKGSILLFDEGNKIQNPSGIIVSIENTNPQISTTTDNKGDYTLQVPDNLNTFTITYSSPDMGTVKRSFRRNPSGSFSRRDLDNVFQESKYGFSESFGYKSTVTVNSFSLSLVNDSTLAISCNISSPNTSGEKYIRLLTQKDLTGISINTVDLNNPRTHLVFIPVTNGNNLQNFCLKCSAICSDWTRNDKIYMTAYGDSYYSNMYVDPASGKLVFPNLNPNNNNAVASFLMPF